jgi:hypothetical protein
VGFIVLSLIALFLYFLPTIVANSRKRQVGSIFVLNLFLGWTLLGWVVALVWAMSEKPPAAPAS